jgi:hypothetical protein
LTLLVASSARCGCLFFDGSEHANEARRRTGEEASPRRSRSRGVRRGRFAGGCLVTSFPRCVASCASSHDHTELGSRARADFQGPDISFFYFFFLYKYMGLYRNLGPPKLWGPVRAAHSAHVVARACVSPSPTGLSLSMTWAMFGQGRG